MGEYFRAVATPVTKEDCMKVLRSAWIKQHGSPPKDGAIRLMTTQWGLETTWGKAGYCYNLGNIRAGKDADYMYIGGNEIIDGKVVWFSADKPSDLAKFRAFRSLDSAAEYYVAFLGRKAPVMEVLKGSCDPLGFVKALRQVGYFTDTVEHYSKTFLKVYKAIEALAVPPPGPVSGYATLTPDPEGDPALRAQKAPAAPAAPSPPAPPALPPPLPVAPAEKSPGAAAARGPLLSRFIVAARLVGTTDAPPHLRVGSAGPAAAPAEPPPPAAPPPPPVEAAPRPKAAERRGARAIFEALPPVVGQEPPEAREEAIWAEVERGNVPAFVNSFMPVTLTDSKGQRATFQVSVDCFAIGTDDDWLRVALSGYYAQKVADLFASFLPTNKIVMEAYKQAAIKLVAHPLDCQSGFHGKWQRSTFAMRLHEDILQGRIPCQRGQKVAEASGRLEPNLGAHAGTCALPPGPHPGILVSGHLKEVILSHEDLSKRLAFWGFFTQEGRPIQRGFGCPHGPGFADYSHGFRLVGPQVDLDGRTVSYEEVVTNPAYATLVFVEGGQPCRPPRYPSVPKRFYMGR